MRRMLGGNKRRVYGLIKRDEEEGWEGLNEREKGGWK